MIDVKIKTFGPVDERSLKQLENCMEAGDAEFGVLCADHHPGYSQPIGGAVAYEGYLSPSGVGYDIGCIAADEPISCSDGVTRPIQRATRPVCAEEGGLIREVAPFLGVAGRGVRRVVKVMLANGRSVTLTDDHRVRTDTGWRRADELRPTDRVLCPVFVGLPHEPHPIEPALLRIAGYVNGDGHIATKSNRVCLYTSKDCDAADLARDLMSLGCVPSIDRRVRPNGRIENAVYVNERSLRERLADLGCPVGRKAGRWGGCAEPILQLPPWARACYLSAFASAEMSALRLVDQRIQPLAIKQRGIDAIEDVWEIADSLGVEVGISRSDGENWYAQVLGGEEAQVWFIERIGFNRAAGKRLAGAAVVGTAWERSSHLRVRRRPQSEMRETMASRERIRDAVSTVATRNGLTEAVVWHLAYRRGAVRRARGWCPQDRPLGESVYSAVADVSPAGERNTFDVVTADPAEAFVAGAIAVHNCGNKATLTDLTHDDLAALGGVEPVMHEITRRISFGMGVPAKERGEHPVLEKIRHAEFEPQRKLAGLAESQLGTVGSGNHYVNVMEATPTSRRWGSLGSTPTLGGMWWWPRCSRSWAPTPCTRCTTTTISPGARSTPAAPTG